MVNIIPRPDGLGPFNFGTVAVAKSDDSPIVGPVGFDGPPPGRVESVGAVRHSSESPVVAHNIRLAVNNVRLRGHAFPLNTSVNYMIQDWMSIMCQKVRRGNL